MRDKEFFRKMEANARATLKIVEHHPRGKEYSRLLAPALAELVKRLVGMQDKYIPVEFDTNVLLANRFGSKDIHSGHAIIYQHPDYKLQLDGVLDKIKCSVTL